MNTDNIVDLLPWDVVARGAERRGRVKDLLARPDADEAITALSPVEAVLALKELGAGEAAPLAAVVTEEQIRALFDLDTWERDRLRPEDVLIWLEAFREIGVERLAEAVRTFDRETLAVLFRRRLKIALKTTDEDEWPDWIRDPPEELMPIVETPDRRFWIAARTVDEELEDEDVEALDEEERKSILRLVDDLYRADPPDVVVDALRTAHDDSLYALEEDAYRFRTGRLEDLGFPSFERAQEMLAPLPKSALGAARIAHPPASEHKLPAPFLADLGGGRLEAGLRLLDDRERIHEIEGELVTLAQAALVRGRVELGNAEALHATLTELKGAIEIGLGIDAPADEAKVVAAERLLRLPLQTIARVGAGELEALGARARRVRGRVEAALGRLSRLGEGDRELLSSRLRPGSVEELGRAVARLDEIETKLAILGGLSPAFGGEVLPPDAEQTLDAWVATIALNAAEDEVVLLEPLGAAALLRLSARASASPGSLTERAASAIAAERGLPLERIRAALAPLLAPIAESLAGVSGAIDPRFLDGFLRRPR